MITGNRNKLGEGGRDYVRAGEKGTRLGKGESIVRLDEVLLIAGERTKLGEGKREKLGMVVRD